MSRPLLVIGGGGHASVLVDILRQQKRKILGIVCLKIDVGRKVFDGIPHYASDDNILQFSANSIKLVNAIGSMPNDDLRAKIYERFVKLGYEFDSIIAPSATVSPYAILDKGSQVMARAIIQTGSRIGENTIVNSGSIVEHDCNIGGNNHLAPGVTLSGGIITGEKVHIGTGASVIQSLVIGENAVIGAGAIVTKNITSGTIVYPARSEQKVISKNES